MKAIFSFKLLLLSALGILGLPAKADPTRPPTLAGAGVNAGTERAEQALMLQLIIKNADGYRAMLNGQMVKAGDRLAAYRVLNITAERVVLVSENGQIQLTINNNSIKTYEPE
ncbi:hypothetical protein [Alishewanella longhuensis]